MRTIDSDALMAMLTGAAKRVRADVARLSRLDSHGGDGDHGMTMTRAMGEVEKIVGTHGAARDPASAGEGNAVLSTLLRDVGWAVMGADGGATGPLLGAFFTAMGNQLAGVAGDELDARTLASAFGAGLEGVQKYSKAQVGDKTMIDALAPAVGALAASAQAGGDVTEALLAAAEAAEQGALATIEMQARFGRAKNLGARSVGHEDPGAASMALIFRGFADGVMSNG